MNRRYFIEFLKALLSILLLYPLGFVLSCLDSSLMEPWVFIPTVLLVMGSYVAPVVFIYKPTS